MPPAKPAVKKLSELAAGESADFFAQLVERHKSTLPSGKPFFNCRFRDAYRQVGAVIWAGSPLFALCENEWQVGQFYKVRGPIIETEKYGQQVEIQAIRIVNDGDREEGFDPAELVERSRHDSHLLFEELKSVVVKEIADTALKILVVNILDHYRNDLETLPGSTKHYYPFAGGWIEHTLSVTKNCILLVDRYREVYADAKQPINRDVVIAAAALHDIGRVVELVPPLGLESTVPGRLIGHLLLGRDLVRDAARLVENLDPDTLLLLEHILLSYLALPEWGSPRLPAVPECLILHYADDLDAKMEMYMRCLKKDVAAGPFTDRDPVLGKALWKGRKV
jgi:3'-5' exoribonuclease